MGVGGVVGSARIGMRMMLSYPMMLSVRFGGGGVAGALELPAGLLPVAVRTGAGFGATVEAEGATPSRGAEVLSTG